MKKVEENVYTIEKDVICVKCNNKGAIQFYGTYYPDGLGETDFESYKKFEETAFLSRAVGFGGTIPHECLNCGNVGLIDISGLEGYDMAFRKIK